MKKEIKKEKDKKHSPFVSMKGGGMSFHCDKKEKRKSKREK